jgi:hypothetical protein
VSNRVLSFRAALLLIISSAAIIWPISYWLPLPNYLAVLSTSEYAQFANTLRGIVIVYILFLVMNIVSAVLAFTRLDYRIRAALLAIPTLSLVIAPLVLIIPNAQHFTDRSYFTVLQAIYRLLRFTTPQLLVTVLVVTLLCFALNLFALVLIFRDKSESIDEMPKETRKAYVTLASILSLATVVSLISGATAAQNRALDRQACANYAALAVPENDEGVPVFLSDIQLYGEAAGTDQVKTPMVTFAEKSRQYYSLYYSDEETNVDLDALLEEVRAAKDQIAQVCVEYSVD